jgi:hypothetical protein
MLAYISVAITLCSITVCLVFGLTWAYLGHEIRHSSLLQDEFATAVRRFIATIGIFVIPVGAYFLDGAKQYANNAEPFAFRVGRLLRREFIDLGPEFNHSDAGC